MVPGKGPPRAIGAVHARRQADDEQPGLRVAERRHGPAEIIGLLAGARGREMRRDADSAGNRIENAVHSDGRSRSILKRDAYKKRATRISA